MQAARVCWTVDHVTVCNELCFELLRLELHLIVFHNDVKKDIALLSSPTSTSSGFWS